VETCVAYLANSLPESRPNRVQSGSTGRDLRLVCGERAAFHTDLPRYSRFSQVMELFDLRSLERAGDYRHSGLN
jgi:hypothetical protein